MNRPIFVVLNRNVFVSISFFVFYVDRFIDSVVEPRSDCLF